MEVRKNLRKKAKERRGREARNVKRWRDERREIRDREEERERERERKKGKGSLGDRMQEVKGKQFKPDRERKGKENKKKII